MPLVDVAIEDSIGTLTMNYGKKHNALCAALVDDLIIAFGQLREQRARVAILRAVKGVGVWSAGHDINELPLRRDPLGWDDPLRHLIRESNTFPHRSLRSSREPCGRRQRDGICLRSGRSAAPGVTFAVTPARLGVPYNVTGMLTFLNSADIRIVKEMAFTARADLGAAGRSAGHHQLRRRQR